MEGCRENRPYQGFGPPDMLGVTASSAEPRPWPGKIAPGTCPTGRICPMRIATEGVKTEIPADVRPFAAVADGAQRHFSEPSVAHSICVSRKTCIRTPLWNWGCFRPAAS